jgi:type VI secretion system secreted protein Hcp
VSPTADQAERHPRPGLSSSAALANFRPLPFRQTAEHKKEEPMAIYMQVEGIEGTVTEAKHAKWIQVGSFQWGVGRGISMDTGSIADRGNTKPSLSEIVVTKSYDSASPKLFTWATVGTGKKVVLHFTKEDGSSYLEVTLESVIPSGYSLSSGGDEPSESLSMSYVKIEMKRIPYDENNKAGTPIPVGYDLKTMKPS